MSRRSNYDKYPATKVAGEVLRGWNSILEKLSGELAPNQTLVVELYTGVYEDEVEQALKKQFGDVLNTRSLMKPEKEIVQMTEEFMTDDTFSLDLDVITQIVMRYSFHIRRGKERMPTSSCANLFTSDVYRTARQASVKRFDPRKSFAADIRNIGARKACRKAR